VGRKIRGSAEATTPVRGVSPDRRLAVPEGRIDRMKRLTPRSTWWHRLIGSRSDEVPAVRIVIGGNIPLEGMTAVTPPALPVSTDPNATPDL
jgi:hypothetical protein